ncbi:MAG: hypothetical protein ACRD0P_27965 [Stackebrandtia sp.]
MNAGRPPLAVGELTAASLRSHRYRDTNAQPRNGAWQQVLAHRRWNGAWQQVLAHRRSGGVWQQDGDANPQPANGGVLD